MDFNISTCALIIVLCYVLGIFAKKILKSSDTDTQLIPAILMVCGAIIAGIIYVVDPSYLGVASVFDAIFVGLVSGFASTGANQLLKKFLPTSTDET